MSLLRRAPWDGTLGSIQGLSSTMPHDMVETPHGADFSFSDMHGVVASSKQQPSSIIAQHASHMMYSSHRVFTAVLCLPLL